MRVFECKIDYYLEESELHIGVRQIRYKILLQDNATDQAVENEMMASGLEAICRREVAGAQFEVIDVQGQELFPTNGSSRTIAPENHHDVPLPPQNRAWGPYEA
jgi:hypothetical protein